MRNLRHLTCHLAGLFRVISVLISGIAILGCAKVASPIPPERLGPANLAGLEVKATQSTVTFAWTGPENDVRGKPLKSLDGYRIYRKEIVADADLQKNDIPFEIVTELPDKSLELLKTKQEAAEAQGHTKRRVKLSATDRQMNAVDSSVETGKTYVYKVLAFNQSDIDGDAKNVYKVVFQGESSEITMLDNTAELDLGIDPEDQLNQDASTQYR